jgi:hypothetical protein
MVPTPPTGQFKWALTAAPMSELRSKPWSIAQILAGPIAIGGGAASVWAAGMDPDDASPRPRPRGVKSHVRVFEIGTLYTAVAGMLNLLAVIDAAARAGRIQATRPWHATAAAGGHGGVTA